MGDGGGGVDARVVFVVTTPAPGDLGPGSALVHGVMDETCVSRKKTERSKKFFTDLQSKEHIPTMINPKPCGHLCCCIIKGCEQVSAPPSRTIPLLTPYLQAHKHKVWQTAHHLGKGGCYGNVSRYQGDTSVALHV